MENHIVVTSRKINAVLLMLLNLMLAACTTWEKDSVVQSASVHLPLHYYQLNHILGVEDHQDITTDGDFYYVSGSKALYNYYKNYPKPWFFSHLTMT